MFGQCLALTGHVWTSLDIVGQHCKLHNRTNRVRATEGLYEPPCFAQLDTCQQRPQTCNNKLPPTYITVLDPVQISGVDHNVEGNCIFPELAVDRSLLCRHVRSGVTNTGRGFPHRTLPHTVVSVLVFCHRRVLSWILIYSWWRDY